jgi:hypothetical protein
MTEPIQPTEDELNLKKLKLEVQRLELEQQKYMERLRLSDLKLRSDVRDWYYRVLIALVSTVVGVLTFLWTQSYQRYSDDLKITAARLQEQDTRFEHLVVQLSDASPALRVAAADGLSGYVQFRNQKLLAPSTVQHFWQLLTNNSAPDQSFTLEAQVYQQRRTEAIQAAADRLSNESDSQVLEALGRLFLDAKDISVEPVVHANKLLANSIARTFGSMIATTIAGNNYELCDSWDQNNNQLATAALLLARIQMPYQGESIQLGFDFTNFVSHSFMVREFVTVQCHLDVTTLNKRGSPSQLASLQGMFAGQAKALALTSYVLLQIVKGADHKLTLDGVQLVTGTGHSALRLTNLSLQSIYLTGTPSYFSCTGCNLANASLQDLDLRNGANFDGSNLCGVHFQELHSLDKVVLPANACPPTRD